MKKNWVWWLAGCLFVIGIVARIWLAARPTALWWDEAIYLGMAKWVFSGGALGYWEYFRPPLFAFVLGFGWWAGLPILVWGKIVALLSSFAVMALTFFIGERVKKGVGLIALALLVPLPTFFFFGTKLLTGVFATAFALWGVWFFMNKRYFFSGVVVGLAVLSRFTHGVFIIGLGIAFIVAWITQKKWSTWKKAVIDMAKLGVGFLVPLIPYLIINLVRHDNAFAPFIEASRVFTQYNNWVYDYGNWYYLQQTLMQNILFVFVLVGLWFFVVKKWFKKSEYNALLFPMLFIVIYFLQVAHKEIRFFVPAFPFFALLTGIGIVFLIEQSKRLVKYKQAIILGVVIISLCTGFFVGATVEPEAEFSGPKKDFYEFFKSGTVDDPKVIGTTPLFMSYTDKPYQPLRSWTLANKVYGMYGDESSHVAIDMCDHPCEPDSECEVLRASFVQKMHVENMLVFNDSYVRWDDVTCSMLIWEIS